MLRWCYIVSPIWLLALLAPLYSQAPVRWHDPSPHVTQFVTVDKDVRLEVLDWGGSGTPVILLAGGGNTAHVFDDFAPKLRAYGHVYAITRRGFGASTYSPIENSDRLGEDVLAVIRVLKLNKPVLVGHSIAGAELSAVAALQPNSIAGLVYLEAAYPYAFDNGAGPTMKDFQEIQGPGPQPPTPSESHLATFSALQKWDARTYGFQMPESEFRQTWESTSTGRVTKQRDFPGSQSFMTIMTSTRNYVNIPVPALVIFAIPHVPDRWMTASADPAILTAADTYYAKLDGLAKRQAKALQDGVPGAHVVMLKGMHYIFLSNESDVLREMRSFLSALK